MPSSGQQRGPFQLFTTPLTSGPGMPTAGIGAIPQPNVAVSGTSTFLSNVIDTGGFGITLGIEAVFFGGMQGSFQLLASNDYNEQTGVGNWLPVTGVTLPAPGAAVTRTDGVTLATAHGSSTADGVTVAGGPPTVQGTTDAFEVPFWIATITSATYGFTSGGVAVGDVIVVSAGADSGTYPITAIASATSISVAVPSSKSFVGTSGQTIQVNSTLTGTLTSAGASFVTAGVQPGMQVTISAGAADLGIYQVLQVTSGTVLVLATNPQPSRSYSAGRTAFVGASNLTYAIPQSWFLNLTNPGARFYMLAYTNTSSTGTLSATATVKG